MGMESLLAENKEKVRQLMEKLIFYDNKMCFNTELQNVFRPFSFSFVNKTLNED